MPSRTILVTGAAGFIGSHLVARLLAGGDHVVGVDNFDPFYDRSTKQDNLDRIDHDHFEFHEGDILDTAMMTDLMRSRGVDAVVNVAALAGVRPSLERPDRYVRVNVMGVVSILEAMRAAGVVTLLHASSSSVYGNNEKVPFAETDAVDRPISPYAASKRSTEVILQAHLRAFGGTMAALRFFTVFGPGQRPDLAIGTFMRRIAAGETVPMFGDGSTSRDYTYIDDITHGVCAALDRVCAAEPPFFRIWNLGHAHPVRLLDMIEAIGRVVGREAVIERLPMQPGDVERTFAEVTRAERELGYRPQVEFEDGLRRQWAWLRPRLASSV